MLYKLIFFLLCYSFRTSEDSWNI